MNLQAKFVPCSQRVVLTCICNLLMCKAETQRFCLFLCVCTGILGESGLYAKLQRLTHGCIYCIYGDPAYPLRPLLMRPYGGATLTAQQQLFNEGMSTVRQAVEWGFGKVIAEFAFVDFRKNQKILLQNVGQMYRVATLLTNCHTCLYGSQTGMYFGLCAPLLEDYLVPRFN